MISRIEGFTHNNLLLAIVFNFFPFCLCHSTHEDYCHKLGHLSPYMYDFPCLVSASSECWHNHIHCDVRQRFKNIDLTKKHAEEVFFIWGSMALLTDRWNRHQFFFIILIHELQEAFFLDEPFRVLFKSILAEVEWFCIGVATIFAMCAKVRWVHPWPTSGVGLEVIKGFVLLGRASVGRGVGVGWSCRKEV